MRKGSALTYPVGGRVLHAKNAIAFFAKRTRFEQSADLAFAASKRTAKTAGISTGRSAAPVGRGFTPAAPEQNNFLYTVLRGSEAARGE